jgi:hypothetical protein
MCFRENPYKKLAREITSAMNFASHLKTLLAKYKDWFPGYWMSEMNVQIYDEIANIISNPRISTTLRCDRKVSSFSANSCSDDLELISRKLIITTFSDLIDFLVWRSSIISPDIQRFLITTSYLTGDLATLFRSPPKVSSPSFTSG